MKMLMFLALFASFAVSVKASEVNKEPISDTKKQTVCKKPERPYSTKKFCTDVAQGVAGSAFMILALYTALKTIENAGITLGWAVFGKVEEKVHQVENAIVETIVGRDTPEPSPETLSEHFEVWKKEETPAIKTALWGTTSIASFILGLKFLKRALYCS